ncbi:PTPA-CTERM sorting domain-containing protein [[Leptolyngbya] sp. PCC 7376]|uniref:PTPA-CTERM sorting domain-containing protein n=1 Tax=[Leptolyngbya] sp. PCC 7376 TaxID=111781 RepID=UPI00031924BA|nr:PTPA-CTERM sorting domain-containing protein [[Leptolyngbya] sp. PCC 7376]
MKLSGTQLIFSGLGAVTLSCGILMPAHALTLTTFTDQAEFEAIATGLSLETFNDATLSDSKNHTLSDFSISSNMTWSRIVEGSTAGTIDDSAFFRLQSRNPDTAATLNFTNTINSLGFDWKNTDNSVDVLELIVDGQVFEFGQPKQGGFFGVIATEGSFDSVQFSDTEGGGFLQYGSIDNIRYGQVDFSDDDPQAVPTPAALLPNLSLIGLNVLRRRRSQTESQSS